MLNFIFILIRLVVFHILTNSIIAAIALTLVTEVIVYLINKYNQS